MLNVCTSKRQASIISVHPGLNDQAIKQVINITKIEEVPKLFLEDHHISRISELSYYS